MLSETENDVTKYKHTFTKKEEKQMDKQFGHIKLLAEMKYQYEIDREKSLITQSNQMQAVFSIMSVAILMFLPLIVDNNKFSFRIDLVRPFLFVLLLQILSFLLALLAQWRPKKIIMSDIKELKDSIIGSDEWVKLTKSYAQSNQKIILLEQMEESLITCNKRRVHLIQFSIITSLGSVIMLAILICHLIFYIN
ncbi:MAG: hypothetical protein GT601_18235 [Acidaminobacter sp.]|uniref:hypothetical protein n=1 Tax=Acidaminobacter sp. TaxID=1872102 RepID=UPI001382F0AD|nr:hypothetical protein [Acidaminobacter sp.]MZQ99611.1 hypothetical protein [Acidaminobacter sp.]